MEIKLAKTAGYCFGVKRAVNSVYEQIEKYKDGSPIYTYGPIIHNKEVVKDLESKGVLVINNLEELNKVGSGTIIIRAHGVSTEVYEAIEKKGLKIIDATCPLVKKIHHLVEEYSSKGYDIVIIGNAGHPEVEGIKGWSRSHTTIIGTQEEAEKFVHHSNNKICIVAQTTLNYNKFEDLVEKVSKKGYDILVLNTICNATKERQEEARQIAGEVDAMIIIGDKDSSNTQKLYEICKELCKDTYYIQTLDDLDLCRLQSTRCVGITAGASTPNYIIEEVHTLMSELSFEQMLEESLKTIRTGEVVEGTVISVKEDEIVLNIGYKSDGIITRNEYSNNPNVDLTTCVSVGDKMEAKVLKVNDGEGQVLLTYKRIAAEKGYKRLEEAFNNQEVLKAKVIQVMAGGLSVAVDESKVFIPASLVSDAYEKDLSKYANQEIEFVITEFNPKKRRIIGDRKKLIVAEKNEMQKELLGKLETGMAIEGTVKNITDFGAFIDLGGIDGLLHISEMSWGRIENPKKILKVGDKIKVLIKEINGDKIALSLKFDDENPWLNAASTYAVGSIIKGRVARMTDFGAFVELEPGIDALLHVSQISIAHVDKPSDALKIGQEIEAKVVDLNIDEKKISLSMKAIEEAEPEAHEPSEDSENEQQEETIE